jgi:hypothetical protein
LLDFQNAGEAVVFGWQTAHSAVAPSRIRQINGKIEAALVIARDVRASMKQSAKR